MKTLIYLTLLICSLSSCFGQTKKAPLSLIAPSDPLPQALSDKEIKSLTYSVDKGLKALAMLQLKDGSFRTVGHAKPAITSFAIMAFLSRGHKPGEGPYGKQLDKALNYVLAVQKKSGLFAEQEINYPLINTKPQGGDFYGQGGASKTYCHAICMLMLGEVYGLTEPQRAFRIRQGITNGLKCTLQLWDIRKSTAQDDGGFRYTRPWTDHTESDISVTGWYAASLRSIRNAGFDVPEKVMNRIAHYVIGNQHSNGGFRYIGTTPSSFVMTAAGTLCVALAGKHNHPALKKSCLYLSRFSADYRRSFLAYDGKYYPYYTCYYVTQASFQMGGALWARCMKECYRYLLPKQSSSGLWPNIGSASHYGSAYSTSLAIIALTPSLQLLPIYQR
ncbi:terpene cyclase/mutase family protein [Rubritalea profundi]|uniref:Squalene cyclase C-terminal domain-containing protein n=1 Tax=Rubritalea profundi TaxID=1658618 RepID=A0A2S7U304_9BACT|nr:terpene cyclase/mutase family protein [Rubritalea profundi]PQJ28563.1 hypothetical protein BSZ32_08600 [Rubritalea profundi]